MEKYKGQQPEKDPSILIQAELLKKHPDWIDMHAEEFRSFINDNPDIVERYMEDPQVVVSEVEKRFYH